MVVRFNARAHVARLAPLPSYSRLFIDVYETNLSRTLKSPFSL